MCISENQNSYCKMDKCENAEIYHFIDCIFLNTTHYKNVMYKIQLDCIVSRYDETLKIKDLTGVFFE